MTTKNKLFCMEYLKDLNATQAAIRTGYSDKTAYSIGWELLRKPEIRLYIDQTLQERMDSTKTELKGKILKALEDIGFSDDLEEIRVNDKLKAMELLGKYLAIWTEKHEISGDMKVAYLPAQAQKEGL